MRGVGTGLRAALALVVGALAVLAFPAPARADGELQVSARSYACSPTEAGRRTGGWRISSLVDAAGTVTAVSVSPPEVSLAGLGVGDAVGNGGYLSVTFSTGAGPDAVTVSVSVHWDAAPPGPLDASLTDTIALNPCVPKPAASFTQDCAGQVKVSLTNGSLSAHTAGGTAVFTITGTGGYRQDNVAVNAGAGVTQVVPAANAAHLQVSADGQPVAEGSAPYPGCAVPPSPTRSRSPSPSPSGSTSPAPAVAVSVDDAGATAGPIGPLRFPSPTGRPALAAESAGRPFAILASVIAVIGTLTGVARWLAGWRLRRSGTGSGDLPG